jgi:predicted lactoylglutathione lyase
MIKKRFDLLCLGVEEIQRSVEFYTRSFNYQPLILSESTDVAFLQTECIVLELFLAVTSSNVKKFLSKLSDQDKMSRAVFCHNVSSRHEVDDFLQNVKNAGGEIIKEGGPTSWGGYNGYFLDPDDYCWAVVYWEKWLENAQGFLQKDR